MEGHWSETATRPVLKYDPKTQELDERQMLQMIERNPIPHYYNKSDSEEDSNNPFQKDAFKTSQLNKGGDREIYKSKKSSTSRSGSVTKKSTGSPRK